jgi:hypothetical protein
LFAGCELERGSIVSADPPQRIFVDREKSVLPGILGTKKILTNGSVPCIIVSSDEVYQGELCMKIKKAGLDYHIGHSGGKLESSNASFLRC